MACELAAQARKVQSLQAGHQIPDAAWADSARWHEQSNDVKAGCNPSTGGLEPHGGRARLWIFGVAVVGNSAPIGQDHANVEGKKRIDSTRVDDR